MIPALTHWLMLNMSCKRFAHQVAEQVAPLQGGLYTRFHFWLHWVVCPFCRRYWDEIKMIGKAHRSLSALANHPAVRLQDVKDRIKTAVRSRTK